MNRDELRKIGSEMLWQDGDSLDSYQATLHALNQKVQTSGWDSLTPEEAELMRMHQNGLMS
jgi:hypothetical protein